MRMKRAKKCKMMPVSYLLLPHLKKRSAKSWIPRDSFIPLLKWTQVCMRRTINIMNLKSRFAMLCLDYCVENIVITDFFFHYIFQILRIQYGHSKVSLVNNHTQQQSSTIKLSNKKWIKWTNGQEKNNEWVNEWESERTSLIQPKRQKSKNEFKLVINNKVKGFYQRFIWQTHILQLILFFLFFF